MGISSALGRLLEESTQIVPLHQRVKFTGRQEALRVRALCDYQKDGVREEYFFLYPFLFLLYSSFDKFIVG